MKITKFIEAKQQGNTIGFLGLEINCNIEGTNVPMCFDITIMRNSNNGRLFINWPSRPYQSPEGQTKYAPQIKWPKEWLDFVQNMILKKFNEMISSNREAFQRPEQQKINHSPIPPNQYKNFKENEEELPF